MILGNVSFPCSIKNVWVGVGISFLKCLELKLRSLTQRAKENMWKSQSQFTKVPLPPHHYHKYMGDWTGCISGKYGMRALLLTSSLSDSAQQSYPSQIHKGNAAYSQLSKQFFEAHPTAFSGVCSEYQNFHRVVLQKNSLSTFILVYFKPGNNRLA